LSGIPVGVGGSSPLHKSLAYTSELRLSHEQSAFSVTFSAPTYLSPAENRYRYKLEGLDKAWHEVGSDERVAAYTSLPTGMYTFRAEAATRRGPWGAPGVTLKIEIVPRLWETAWFQAICCTFLGVSLWVLYRARLQQIAAHFDIRLEERVAERTRIARELHDNLLQSFHGLMLRFQLVQKMLPGRPVEAQRALMIAIERAAQAITEGRDAVQALRSSTLASNELIPALTTLGEEMAAIYSHPDSGQDAASFRLLVEGTPEALHPILQEELFRIAREAVGNAFRHARAKHIEVEIRFDGNALRLRVRDDGVGIDPSVDANRCEGHWGIRGMRERAKTLGAHFELWSEAGAGTEIEISVPELIAYHEDRGAAASNGNPIDR
jgi:signal transduction histidine kinase